MTQRLYINIFFSLFTAFFFHTVEADARANITIQFQSRTSLQVIDSILAHNITDDVTVKLLNNLELNLIPDESSVADLKDEDDHRISIFPNPMVDYAICKWFNAVAGDVVIDVFDLRGKAVLSRKEEVLAGYNEFKLILPRGIFLLKVSSSYSISKLKVISQSTGRDFSLEANNHKSSGYRKVIINTHEVTLPYSSGDKLLYKAYSGNMTTIIPDSPTESKTVGVDFYECKDPDGNHYPVVVLGRQVWMAENLNSTRFRNGELIPEIQSSANWNTTNGAARCFYLNDYMLTLAYGQLYNFNAITDSRFLAPEGWRLPTDADFLSLDTFLIAQGHNYDLSQQDNKIATSVSAARFLWDISENEGTPGYQSGSNNSSGFGALPAGYRNAVGDFVQKRKSAAFWTMTPYGNIYAWNRRIDYDRNYFSREIGLLQSGFSVRCLRPVAGQTEAPVIYTDAATEIGSASASVKTILFSDGGNQVTETGVCWNTGPEPKITDNKMAIDAGVSAAVKLSGLKFNTGFYVRAYVISGKAVYYGNEISFNTLPLKVFDHAALPEIRIEVSTQEWNKLLQYFDQNPHNEEKVVSKFSFTSNGYNTVVEPVGLRLRGNTSRRRPEGSKGTLHNPANPDWHHASFSVDMNEYVSGQRFAGLRRVNLKWFKDDSMYAREIYCYDLFRRFGVWTSPQSSYCKMYIHVAEDQNPAYFGIYELLESVDTDYVSNRKQQFGDDKGFLWKAFWGADFKDADANKMGIEQVTLTSTYKPVYDLKNRPAELDKAKTELLQFIRDLNQKQGTTFETWIESKTDVELLLRTYAVSVMCGMWDDYWNNKNNFYFYFNSQGKFFFIPYDYDNTLGTSLLMDDSGRRDLLNWGNNSHPLIYKVLQIQKYRNMYISFLHELADEKNDLFHVNRSRPRIQQWHQLIRDYIANDTGEDMVISDKPASWGNCSFYRLLETGNNYFVIRSSNLPARN
jgi:spore coat protein H